MEKTTVGIIFGGKSAEHEVSLQSAKNVIDAIDRDKYEVVLIGMDKKGRWYLNKESQFLLNSTNPELIQLNKSNEELALIPGEENRQFLNVSKQEALNQIDVVFPILHGPYGEDGTVQGMLKLANIPFVGAGVLGSAIGMDKDVMKRLLRDAGIAIADFLVIMRHEINDIKFRTVKEKLGIPLFIKPANLGSSVGISKANTEEEFYQAINLAFEYDNKIIVEEAIEGREIECSVLGNQKPIASVPGEIIANDDFYSYQAKYIDENGAILEIPAKIPEDIKKQIRDIAIKTFKVLCCEGMARIDLFLKEDDTVVVNEINTIPGFTKISMYPKLWELSGIPYQELINKLIELAIQRFEREQKLKTEME
ncbi:MAG TPA: D-alanine--D-alanine ligase [Halanaerobiales bacterium]|nr:D-alanine--D-alanine ligase [Halanaerobiales bacterium]